MLLLSPYHRRRLASAVATEAARSGVNNLQEAERSILLALELAQANLARGLEDVSFVFPNHTTASAFDINSRMFAFEHSLHIRKAQREALLRVSQLLFL